MPVEMTLEEIIRELAGDLVLTERQAMAYEEVVLHSLQELVSQGKIRRSFNPDSIYPTYSLT